MLHKLITLQISRQRVLLCLLTDRERVWESWQTDEHTGATSWLTSDTVLLCTGRHRPTRPCTAHQIQRSHNDILSLALVLAGTVSSHCFFHCSQLLLVIISIGLVCVKRFALCYRTVVCPICLSVCLTLVYCGQTVGWIKMSLGTEVGLHPGNIVFDGYPASHARGLKLILQPQLH